MGDTENVDFGVFFFLFFSFIWSIFAELDSRTTVRRGRIFYVQKCAVPRLGVPLMVDLSFRVQKRLLIIVNQDTVPWFFITIVDRNIRVCPTQIQNKHVCFFIFLLIISVLKNDNTVSSVLSRKKYRLMIKHRQSITEKKRKKNTPNKVYRQNNKKKKTLIMLDVTKNTFLLLYYLNLYIIKKLTLLYI